MQRSYWGYFSLLAMIVAFSSVAAQNHNVGYYKVEAYDGENTTLRLVRSLHVEGLENEPELPGDIALIWCGSDSRCGAEHRAAAADCQVAIVSNPHLKTQDIGENIDEVPDCILLVGHRMVNMSAIFLRPTE